MFRMTGNNSVLIWVIFFAVVVGIVHSEERPESRSRKHKSIPSSGKSGHAGIEGTKRGMFMDVLEGRGFLESRSGRRSSKNKMPDLSKISDECPKKAFYYSMNPNHATAVQGVMEVLRGAGSTIEDCLNRAMELRNNSAINPKVWYRALTNYAYGNSMFESMYKPSPIQIMPDIFICAKTLKRAKDESDLPLEEQACVVLDGSIGTDNGIESKMWYFREDIFLNAHHWFYHIANPNKYQLKDRPDRRGELFYYMHHQMLARYNAERFANGCGITKPFALVKDSRMDEGYFPNLEEEQTGNQWTGRTPFRPYIDVLHLQNPTFKRDVYVNELQTCANRMYESIEKGFLVHESGKKISMQDWRSIDILGDIVQAANTSINPKYYGETGLHNNGHITIGLNMDPLYKQMLPPGVMTDEATAIRDPIFYRWHTFIDDIFNRYQQTLEPYKPLGGEFPLFWEGICIKEMDVMTPFLGKNELHTFFTMRSLSLPRGLDLAQIMTNTKYDGTLRLCVKHLDHKPFNYRLVIDRENFVKNSKATIRLFMAPRFQSNGKQFSMVEQRQLFFVMDTFTVNLKVGRNVIYHNSTETALTIRPEEILHELDEIAGTGNNDVKQKEGYCGCGWPQHLLLPKGTPRGMAFDLFAMVTDGVQDEVKIDPKAPPCHCRSPYLFCGLPGKKYPDARPMNYPFDRMPYSLNFPGGVRRVVKSLEEYVNRITNMKTQQVLIKHVGLEPSPCCDKQFIH